MEDRLEETESNPDKAALNIRKHKKKNREGLSFEEAMVVAYTPRNGKRRIISARPANSRERKVYYDRLGKI